MTYRLLMGVTVLPFVLSGWLLSTWLSEQAVSAVDHSFDYIVADTRAD